MLLTRSVCFPAVAILALFACTDLALSQQHMIGRNFTSTYWTPSGPSPSNPSNGVSSACPPDTMGAVGPDNIVELINGRYTVYTKDAVPTQLVTCLGKEFWHDVAGYDGAHVVDPRIMYDPQSERYYAVATHALPPEEEDRYNHIFIAVSKSDTLAATSIEDLSDDWHGAVISNSSYKALDFPALGFDANCICVSAWASESNTEIILAFPKSSALTGTFSHSTFTLTGAEFSHGKPFQPVVVADANVLTDTTVLLSTWFTSKTLRKWEIDWSGPSGPTFDDEEYVDLEYDTEEYPDGLYIDAWYAVQPLYSYGTSEWLEERTIHAGLNSWLRTACVFSCGYIWCAQTVGWIDESEIRHVGVRWYKIALEQDGGLSVCETGLISDPYRDYYYGSIAVNGFGHVVLGCSSSAFDPEDPANEDPPDVEAPHSGYARSVFFVGQVVRDGEVDEVVWNEMTTAICGESEYSSSGRWGDYSATMVDPNDELRFWTFQEWSAQHTGMPYPIYGRWATQITEIRIALGDVNLDGVVDATDYSTLVENVGETEDALWSMGDLDADGDVDADDLAALLDNMGEPGLADTAWDDTQEDWEEESAWDAVVPDETMVAAIDNDGEALIDSYQAGEALDLLLGVAESGYVTQTGGSLTLGSGLFLGFGDGADAGYSLDGSGSELSAAFEYIGRLGTGLFEQYDGENTVSESVFIGYDAAATGEYYIEGGTLSCADLVVGHEGSGLFAIDDSDAVVNLLRSLRFGAAGEFDAVSDSSIQLRLSGGATGYVANESESGTDLVGLGNLTLVCDFADPASGLDENIVEIEVAGETVVSVSSQDFTTANFVLDELVLGRDPGPDPQNPLVPDDAGRLTVRFVDTSDNQNDGEDDEVLYVSTVTIHAGVRLEYSEGEMPVKVYYLNGGAPKELLAGDANLDGAVDLSDLGILSTYYDTEDGAEWSMADLNGDRAVDDDDLDIIVDFYSSGRVEGGGLSAMAMSSAGQKPPLVDQDHDDDFDIDDVRLILEQAEMAE